MDNKYMIIRTHVDISTLTSAPKKAEVKSDVIVEEVKPIRNEEIISKKRKKTTSIIVEEPVVVNEIVEEEKIDLSKWLEEDIDE